MVLNDIKEKLLEVDEYVFYGAVNKTMQESVWNYIVFDRDHIGINANKSSHSYYFSVHIVRENYIPEGLENQVIEKMLEIPGMRLAGNEPVFDYTYKPSTDAVVEMLTIDFVKPVKV